MATLIFGLQMAKTYKLHRAKRDRLYVPCSLIFLFLIALNACQNREETIELVWKNQRATGIQIPKQLLNDFPNSAADASLKVVLGKGSNQTILGNFVSDHASLLFEPLIPLTPGLTYHILQGNKPIGQLFVPFNQRDKAPELLAIYPKLDTLPENLLKLYLQFSKPMRTGQALQFIHMLDKNQDTLRDVFLNLQPELWDTSGTVLTLWLDPGRIKRGLHLNQKLGNPLKMNETYQVAVSPAWKDQMGLKLSIKYTKPFVAGKRDEQAPNIQEWQLLLPEVGTVDPLRINIPESLDYYLLSETIGIVDQNDSPVKGEISVEAKAQQVIFLPSKPWKAQPYRMQVDARLEDLAGNNLNRVFDRDMRKEKRKEKAFYERRFLPNTH